MAGFLEGIIPPIVTPFEADGRLDLAGYESNVESYAPCDFSGLLVLGSNGEAACLSEEEKVAIIRHNNDTFKNLPGFLSFIRRDRTPRTSLPAGTRSPGSFFGAAAVGTQG